MALIASYSPSSVIDKAIFNFDATGLTDFKLSGLITVSISSPFVYAQYLQGSSNNYAWTPDVAAVYWNATQVSNINAILSTYKQFAQINFSTVVDNTQLSPLGVGLTTNSDINITLISRTDLNFAGMSSINANLFGYSGSQLDILLNVNGFGSTNYSLDSSTYGFHTLMHELGHSLGLSHPHSFYKNGVTTLTADFTATKDVGFSKLGFVINSGADMDKEYFTIMSYDDERPIGSADTFAQTPMILDVIALQDAYGVGAGTSGSGNDTITPGGSTGVTAYRTYFDIGGIDTIGLTNYTNGAYLNMGVSITGASHLVGVSMEMADQKLMASGGSPQSLRWFYGEYENATGSAYGDKIIGNSLDNAIRAGAGDDQITGGGGNDIIDGGTGTNAAIYIGSAKNYTLSIGISQETVKDVTGVDGIDTLSNIQRMQFADQTLEMSWFIDAISLSQISASSFSFLSEVYLAYFNRSPDAVGLNFWAAGVYNIYHANPSIAISDAIKKVSNTFAVSPEATLAFGGVNAQSSMATIQAFVTKVYQNVLNRAPDSGGLAFWSNALHYGNSTPGEFIYNIVSTVNDQVGTADKIYLNAKNAVGLHFSVTNGLTDTAQANNVMMIFNSTYAASGATASISTANALSDGYLAHVSTTPELVVQLVGVSV